ncbi:SDR family NAD(P)-dependent oxidoreductase [Paraburkholderia sp. A2RI-6]|uniref:SDR family NAD(P)-dependent oxidoreductase n=1 Tax=Paraburkholderia sp. A2RI-6 TaxID=3028371 RepID=UPI003B7E23DD
MNSISRKLASKTAIVTGAARGIGLAIAERFAMEGANVVLADLDHDGVKSAATNIAERFNVTATPVRVDVSSPEENARLVDDAIKQFGRVDILVCNAGIVRPGKPIEEITPEQWRQVIDINLMSCVYATTAFVPHAKANRNGRIIYMASVAGQVGGVASEMTYPVTKAGVLCMTKAVARQLGPYNVTVNAIAPGAIQTAMTEVLQYSPEVKKSIPLDRYGDVSDIAAAALYLASDDARYVTGATIDVNGGMAMR